jgi:hypothetical protein
VIGVFNNKGTIDSGEAEGDDVAVPVVVPVGVTAIAVQIKEYALPPPEVSMTVMK